jgi:hypothetical protein
VHRSSLCNSRDTAASLQANPEIQQLWETARCTNVKGGKSQWEMLYNKCSIHLVEDGVAIIIDDLSGLVFPAYQKAVFKTHNTLGLGQKYARAKFPEQVEVLRIYSLGTRVSNDGAN